MSETVGSPFGRVKRAAVRLWVAVSGWDMGDDDDVDESDVDELPRAQRWTSASMGRAKVVRYSGSLRGGKVARRKARLINKMARKGYVPVNDTGVGKGGGNITFQRGR